MQNQAAIESAEATLREAQNDYDRYRELFAQGAVSGSAWMPDLKTLETAQASLQQARFQLANTQQTLTAQIEAAAQTLQQLVRSDQWM